MEMHLAQSKTFQEAKPYGLEHIKIELLDQCANEVPPIFH